ncbi:MAG: hypothetical protein QNK03_04740 [Myxococcota bacterium]|nr:hypothetical protein [Myxococcota bacterium]
MSCAAWTNTGLMTVWTHMILPGVDALLGKVTEADDGVKLSPKAQCILGAVGLPSSGGEPGPLCLALREAIVNFLTKEEADFRGLIHDLLAGEIADALRGQSIENLREMFEIFGVGPIVGFYVELNGETEPIATTTAKLSLQKVVDALTNSIKEGGKEKVKEKLKRIEDRLARWNKVVVFGNLGFAYFSVNAFDAKMEYDLFYADVEWKDQMEPSGVLTPEALTALEIPPGAVVGDDDEGESFRWIPVTVVGRNVPVNPQNPDDRFVDPSDSDLELLYSIDARGTRTRIIGLAQLVEYASKKGQHFIAFPARRDETDPPQPVVVAKYTHSEPEPSDPNCTSEEPLVRDECFRRVHLRVPSEDLGAGTVAYRVRGSLGVLPRTLQVARVGTGIRSYASSRGNGKVTVPSFSSMGDVVNDGFMPSGQTKTLDVSGFVQSNANFSPKRAATPWAVAVHPNRQFAYVTDTGNNVVHQIDVRSNRLVATSARIGTELSEAPGQVTGYTDPQGRRQPRDLRVTPDGRYLLVAAGTQLSILDATTLKGVASYVPSGDGVTANHLLVSVDAHPNSKRAYVLIADRSGVGGKQGGFLAAIDIDADAPPESFGRQVGELQKLFGSDEAVNVRVRDQRTLFVLSKGDRTTFRAQIEPWKIEAGGEIGLPTSTKAARVQAVPNDFASVPQGSTNHDVNFDGAIDIAFDPTNTGVRQLAYATGSSTGNVAVYEYEPEEFTVREIGIRAVSRSDNRLDIQIADNQSCIDGSTFLCFQTVDPQLRLSLIEGLTLPRNITMSQNGEFAVATRFQGTTTKGDIVVVRADAARAIVDDDREETSDRNTLRDLALECYAQAESGQPLAGTCLGGDGDVNGGIELDSDDLSDPILVDGAGPLQDVEGLEQLELEPIIGLTSPGWNDCVADRTDIVATTVEFAPDARYRLLEVDHDTYLAALATGKRPGSVAAGAVLAGREGPLTQLRPGEWGASLDLNETEIPPGSYTLEVGTTLSAPGGGTTEEAIAAVPLRVRQAPPRFIADAAAPAEQQSLKAFGPDGTEVPRRGCVPQSAQFSKLEAILEVPEACAEPVECVFTSRFREFEGRIEPDPALPDTQARCVAENVRFFGSSSSPEFEIRAEVVNAAKQRSENSFVGRHPTLTVSPDFDTVRVGEDVVIEAKGGPLTGTLEFEVVQGTAQLTAGTATEQHPGTLRRANVRITDPSTTVRVKVTWTPDTGFCEPEEETVILFVESS